METSEKPPNLSAEIFEALLEIGREVASTSSEEQLVAALASGIKKLFPDRNFCIRICDVKSQLLTSLYAEGPLKEDSKESLVIGRTSAERARLRLDKIQSEQVKIIDEVNLPFIFEGSRAAISAPLVTSGKLLGLINVEYPAGIPKNLGSDEKVLVLLNNQVAVAVRNIKSIEELRFVRTYLEELLEHANALILVLDQHRKVVVFNKQLAALTGFKKEEVVGQDVAMLIPEHQRERLKDVMTEALRGEAVSNFESYLITHGKGQIQVSFSTSTVFTAQGNVEGVIAIGQDLTTLRSLEMRMVHAGKLAAFGELAASIVHEISGPMTTVVAYTDALLDRLSGQPHTLPSDEEKLKNILKSTDRIMKFTQNLMSYARPAGEKSEPLQIQDALELSLSLCSHLLEQHRVEVFVDFETPGSILGVKFNLVQVFVNLITNACHAMPEGGHLKLSVRQVGPWFEVEVTDRGSGIVPEHLPKIFEPFFTTKAEGDGTGLGLSIVQGIVENHGGDIRVRSAANAGTTFTLRLPSPVFNSAQ